MSASRNSPIAAAKDAFAYLLANGSTDNGVQSTNFTGLSIHVNDVPESIKAPFLLVYDHEDESSLYPDFVTSHPVPWVLPIGISITQPWALPHPVPTGYDHAGAEVYVKNLSTLLLERLEKPGATYSITDRSTWCELSDGLNAVAADQGFPVKFFDSGHWPIATPKRTEDPDTACWEQAFWIKAIAVTWNW